MRVLLAALIVCAALSPIAAVASEADFLKSIEGQWSGRGTALTKIGGSTVPVSCKMTSKAASTTFAMDGSCQALVVVTRTFRARVKANGTKYSGTYVGVSGKPSSLQGTRNANTLNFDVTWAAIEYGDKNAVMTVQKVGADGLRIRTVDNNPETGKPIVTTDLQLKRL